MPILSKLCLRSCLNMFYVFLMRVGLVKHEFKRIFLVLASEEILDFPAGGGWVGVKKELMLTKL